MEDNGRLAGLSKEEMKASMKTLRDMVSKLGANICVIRERLANSHHKNKEERKIAEVLIRKIRKDDIEDEPNLNDLRLAVIGAQDAGKSTLLGKQIKQTMLKIEI